MTTIDKKDSCISKISFICAIMVIALHSYGTGELFNSTVSVFNPSGRTLISCISHGLATIAVPVFFFLSGYLLFENVNSKEILFGKLKRRVRSLIRPYLCWNALYCLFYIISSNSSIGIESIEMNFSCPEIIEAIFFHKYCVNLWFLLSGVVMLVKDTNKFSRAECVLVLGNMLCFLMSAEIWMNRIKQPQNNMNMILCGGAGFVQIIFTKGAVVLSELVNMSEILILLLYFPEIILTVAICYYVGVFMKKCINPVYSLLAGNR